MSRSSYYVEAIKLLVKEKKLPSENGEIPDEVLAQYAGILAFYEAILSKKPKFPLTIWSRGINYVNMGAKLPPISPQPEVFHQLDMSVRQAWINVSGEGENSPRVEVTQPAKILDAKNRKVYP